MKATLQSPMSLIWLFVCPLVRKQNPQYNLISIISPLTSSLPSSSLPQNHHHYHRKQPSTCIPSFDFVTFKLFVLFVSQTEIDQVGPIFLLVGTGDTTVILDNRWILPPHLSCHCSGQDNLDKTAKQASDQYQTMPTTIRRLKCKTFNKISKEYFFWLIN